jgi:hypothetical protein
MTNVTMTQADLLLAQRSLKGPSIDDLIRHAAIGVPASPPSEARHSLPSHRRDATLVERSPSLPRGSGRTGGRRTLPGPVRAE